MMTVGNGQTHVESSWHLSNGMIVPSGEEFDAPFGGTALNMRDGDTDGFAAGRTIMPALVGSGGEQVSSRGMGLVVVPHAKPNDFNGDGTSDVLWRNTATGEVQTWLMTNGQVSGGAGLGMVSSAWQFAGTGDINGDGTTDVWRQTAASGEVDSWLINNGQMSGGAAIGQASSVWQPRGSGDFNGDSTDDV